MMFPEVEYTEFVPVLIIPKKTVGFTSFTLDRQTIFGVESATEEVRYVPKCYWGEVLEMKASMPAQRLSDWGVESAEYCI